MIRRLLMLVVFGFALPGAASAAANRDSQWSLQPSLALSATIQDGRYKLVELKARQTMKLLKTLEEYSRQVARQSDRLHGEMLANEYEDLVATKLLSWRFNAKALEETLQRTYDLENGNVNAGLKKAKAGDFAAIEEALPRIQAFQADYEKQVKKVDEQIAAVRAEYERHYENANKALAAFKELAIIQELVKAKPKLVRTIKLEPATRRPLEWRILLEKEHKDSNDPRFAGISSVVVMIKDGAQTLYYSVVVR